MYEKFSVQVPEAARNLAEKNIDLAEKAIDDFLQAARKSFDVTQSRSMPTAFGDLSRKSFDLTEHNLRATFAHARKLARAKNLSEVLQLQSNYVKSQLAAFQDHVAQRVAAKPGEPFPSRLEINSSDSGTDTVAVTSPKPKATIDATGAAAPSVKGPVRVKNPGRKPKRDKPVKPRPPVTSH